MNNQRDFYKCSTCELAFVPSSGHLSIKKEKARYDQHENDPTDPKYRTFLNQLVKPISKKIAPNAKGLDYGAGPGPTLSIMMGEIGFEMLNYDPIYCNEVDLLKSTYDFVTCTEVVEHFRNPSLEWNKLIKLVCAGGWLGVMTELTDPVDDFPNWYYHKDPTHVCFYSQKTFLWLSEKYNLEVEFVSSRVILLKN